MIFKRITALLLSSVLLFCFCACGEKTENAQKENDLTKFSFVDYESFDTITTVTAYLKSEEEFNLLQAEIQELFRHYDSLFDIYKDYEGVNNIKTINDNAGINPVTVDKEIIDLLKTAKELYGKTDGNINIAFGSVLKLWHDARQTAEDEPDKAYIPDMEALKAASLHCSIDDVIIDEEAFTVFLKDPEMSLDVGSIAKGFAIELIAQRLISEGRTNILISAGGNVRTIGVKPEGTNWVVAIQDPEKDINKPYAATLSVHDLSVVTSGTYERYFFLDGIRYHHIINKDSLMPENNFLSVSILTEDSGLADALSTGIFNMSLDEGKKLIESIENTEAMWILNDKTSVYSSGFEKYIQ